MAGKEYRGYWGGGLKEQGKRGPVSRQRGTSRGRGLWTVQLRQDEYRERTEDEEEGLRKRLLDML